MFTWGFSRERGTAITGPVMGIVNVTPDSFSDGGRWFDADAARAHGAALLAEGAAILDVGGESTRPGAEPVSAEAEIARVVPVVAALAPHAVVSVDTSQAAVAEAAIAAGARIVNDVSAGRQDPDMLLVVAAAGAGFIAMHMQGEPRTMQQDPHYDDVVREVVDHLRARCDAAVAAGIAPESIMVDPGIGFGKTVEHNVALLTHLETIVDRVGVPVLVGASRKSFLGVLAGTGSDPGAREAATIATTVWALEHGAAMVRVHDVAASVRAAAVVEHLRSVAAVAA
ncbi:MAG: dihydropteroate synthase [Planctomycetota bacterium]